MSTPPSQQVELLLEGEDLLPMPVEEVRTCLETWAGALDVPPVEVSLMLGDDATLHTLNREHRGKDKPTDVLSFPQCDGGPEDVLAELRSFPAFEDQLAPLGDIAISMDHARVQAAEYGETLKEAFLRLLCHGFLHLLGYDHERGPEDELLMRGHEARCLSLVGQPTEG